MDVRITSHAKQRAAQRSPQLEENLLDAYRKSVSVGIENYGNGKLHCPTDTIFLKKHVNGVDIVTTVIPATDLNMNTDHLVKCADCGLRYEGGQDCIWCGSQDCKRSGGH